MNEKKICPMMSYRKEYYGIDCTEKCAWYDFQNQQCCLISITSNIGMMTEVCDGSRTLFVREC